MKLNAKKLGWWIFWILPVLYFILYAGSGFSTNDPGFVPALSYRILSGEHSGLDFIYVRPPLTPYLHALEMALLPEEGQVYGMRLVYYLMMAVGVWWGVKSLAKHLDLAELGLQPAWLAVTALVFSYHNYPAMPWHTVDGVFFTMAGLFALTHSRKTGGIVLGLVLFALAAFCKQPFALMPVGAVLLSMLLHGFHPTLRATVISVLLANLGLALLWFFVPNGAEWISLNLEAVRGASGSSDLMQAGIMVYKPAVVFGLPYLLLFVLGRVFPSVPFRGWLVFGAVMLGILTWLVFIVAYVNQEQIYLPPRYGFFHLLLLISLCTSMWMATDLSFRKGMAVLGFLGVASWAAGISWGYSFPAQIALPGIAGTMMFAGVLHDFKPPKWTLPLLAMAGFISFHFVQQYPYMERHRSELTYHAGDVFPELAHIYTHRGQYDMLMDFKQLQKRIGPDFVVLPGLPPAHYLTHTQAVIPLDWEHDGEMGYEKGVARVVAVMEESKPPVLVEKDMKSEAYSANRNYRCSVLAHVLENWQITDSTAYFEVYQAR